MHRAWNWCMHWSTRSRSPLRYLLRQMLHSGTGSVLAKSPRENDLVGSFSISVRFRPRGNTSILTVNSIRSGNYDVNVKTHTQPFNGPLSGTTRVSRYQKGKPLKVVCVCVVQQYKQVHTQMYTSHNKCIYLNSGSSSGISWALCKSAPCSREITTLAPHHSVFYRPDALPAAIPTASKHWRHNNNSIKSKHWR